MLDKTIRGLRLENHITQEELAKKVGVSTSMIGMYETGARKPSYEVLLKIADYFRVTTDYLLGKTKQRVTKEQLTEWDNKYNKDGKLSKEVKSIENAERIALTLDSIPIEFTNPQDARAYISMHQIFGSDGFDADDLSDDEILEFANELLKQMNLISYKYRK